MPYKDKDKSRQHSKNRYKQVKGTPLGERQQEQKTISGRRIRNERKAYLVSLLGGKCVRCGYSKSLWALQFHHINPEDKESKNLSKLSFEKQIEEVKKCILLCANCHIELHEELLLETNDAI
jgi:5-methylcytosine-specific restriction endonuclease McrA